MNSIITVILAVITGFLVKAVDDCEDFNKGVLLARFGGLLYGSLIAIMALFNPVIAPLWLGTVVGNLLYGRFDASSHYVALATIIVLIAAVGMPKFSWVLLLFFVVINLLEEFLHDECEKKTSLLRQYKLLFSVRPLLHLATIAAALALHEFILYGALLVFDLGYLLSGRLRNAFPGKAGKS